MMMKCVSSATMNCSLSEFEVREREFKNVFIKTSSRVDIETLEVTKKGKKARGGDKGEQKTMPSKRDRITVQETQEHSVYSPKSLVLT